MKFRLIGRVVRASKISKEKFKLRLEKIILVFEVLG